MTDITDEMAKTLTIRNLLTNFSGYTTLHGISRLSSNKRIIGKVIWSIIILVCGGFCLRQIYQLCVQYASKSVNTRISIRYQTVYFPYVSLCNLNPISFSRMNSNASWENQLAYILWYYLQKASEDDAANNTERATITKRFKRAAYAEQLFRQGMNFLDTLPISDTIAAITELNPDFDDFIVSCIYDGQPCYKSDFVPFFDHYYGLCYRFPPKPIASQRAGPFFALQLKLNVNQSDYIPLIQDAGIRISIHKPGTKPFLQNNGFSLATGLKTDIAIVQKSIEKLPGRSICDDNGSFNSRLDCFEECRLEKVIQICNCSIFLFENHNISIHPRTCWKLEDIKCMDRVLQTMSDCRCLSPCSQTKYEYTITSSRWPASNFEDTLKDILGENGLNYSSNSLLAVNIFLSSLLDELTIEEPATTVENLMSNIGGTLGLWIGMSIISFGEILELVWLLCRSLLTDKRQSNNNDVVHNDNK